MGVAVSFGIATGPTACADAVTARVPPAAASGVRVASPPPPTTPATAAALASLRASTAAGPATPVVMHRVVAIPQLLDVWSTTSGVELRLGYDDGGGSAGMFRFVPLVDGVPDLDQETSPAGYANTAWLPRTTTETGGFYELLGGRPELIAHHVSGFRSAPDDTYRQLDPYRAWRHLPTPEAEGVGYGVMHTSTGERIEWRAPIPDGVSMTILPRWRSLDRPGRDGAVPAPLAAELERDGYRLSTYAALATGEILAVGRLTFAEGFATVVWRGAVPTSTVDGTSLDDDAPLEILGGDTPETVRLLAGTRVLRFDGDGWRPDGAVSEAGLPDVWFGQPLVRRVGERVFVRLAATEPWRAIPLEGEAPASFAVADGAVWMARGEVLWASRAPIRPLDDITPEELVAGRKRSVMRGGSYDRLTQAIWDTADCSQWYTVLHRARDGEDVATAYGRVGAALVRHAKKHVSAARFGVTREQGHVFLGAWVKDWDAGRALEQALSAAKLDTLPDTLCADPPQHETIRIDPATGRMQR